MADVFISYSRKDQEFVKRLHTALSDRGKDAYVDVEDIPVASRWRQEIAEAIEGADALVFVVSPDSVASPECQKELDHAVTHHKRIIPVACRETETKEAPEALKEIQRISCRKQDDFEAAISNLVEALDTDLDWVKAHTRLLTRAIEWDGKGRDQSHLLRGRNLVEAESWLTQSGDKEPQPTDLQEQYVLASRQGEIRRKRLIRGGLIIGLVAVTVAATVAFFQYRMSLSRYLAAQTQNLLDNQQLDLPLLLSVEACRTYKTQEAQEALLTALRKEPRIKTMFHLYKGYPLGIAFSRDGKKLISGSVYKGISFWDLKTRQALGPRLKGEGKKIECVAFDQKNTILASSNGGLITLWGLENRKILTQIRAIKDWDGTSRSWTEGYKPFDPGPDAVISLAISPEGRVLAAGTRDGAVLLWDLKTYQASGQPLTGHKEYVISLAFSPDGNILASGSRDDSIILWDLKTHKPLGLPLTGHKSDVTSLAFSPDGRTLASGSTDKTIILWDPQTGKSLASPLTGHTDGVTSLAFSPDGRTLASGSNKGAILLWDPRTRQPLDFPLALHKDGVSNIVFSPDGQTLGSGSWDGTIILWDTRLRKGSGSAFRGHHRDDINRVAFSPDGKILASASEDHSVIFWDAKTLEFLGPALEGHRGGVRGLAFSPDGSILATGGRDDDCTILLWNTRSRKLLQPPLRGHKNWIDCLAFSPDGKTLASGSADETIILWDINTHKPLGPPLRGHEENVFSVAFSPDGRILASGGYDQVIMLWDLEACRPLMPPLEGHKGPINSVAFSPDGRTLASGSNDSTIILWDVRTWQPMGSPLKEKTSVESVAFSPDGTILAAGGADGTAHIDGGAVTLWNLKTRQPLGPPLNVPDWRVKTVAFSPDGQTLASGSLTKGTIMVWNVKTHQPLGPALISQERDLLKALGESDLKEYFERACRIANRNLTREEWRQYMGVFWPYRKTCPGLPGL